MTETQSILSRLTKMKDEVLADVTQEFLTNPRFAAAMGTAVQRVMKTKKKLDRNVAMLISLSGIPSKTDYDRLADRAQNLGKSIARIEERIDEMVLKMEHLSGKLRNIS
jgi:hypothetical protein